jgi:hypothetical protein
MSEEFAEVESEEATGNEVVVTTAGSYANGEWEV